MLKRSENLNPEEKQVDALRQETRDWLNIYDELTGGLSLLPKPNVDGEFTPIKLEEGFEPVLKQINVRRIPLPKESVGLEFKIPVEGLGFVKLRANFESGEKGGVNCLDLPVPDSKVGKLESEEQRDILEALNGFMEKQILLRMHEEFGLQMDERGITGYKMACERLSQILEKQKIHSRVKWEGVRKGKKKKEVKEGEGKEGLRLDKICLEKKISGSDSNKKEDLIFTGICFLPRGNEGYDFRVHSVLNPEGEVLSGRPAIKLKGRQKTEKWLEIEKTKLGEEIVRGMINFVRD